MCCYLNVQSTEKSDFFKKVSQRGVKSLRSQFQYGPEISYYLSDLRPGRYWNIQIQYIQKQLTFRD